MVTVKFLIPSSKRRSLDMFKSPSLKWEVNFLFTAKGEHVELLLGRIGVCMLSRVQIHLCAKKGQIGIPDRAM